MAPRRFVSGLCANSDHLRCPGIGGTERFPVRCACDCHKEEER